MRQDQPWNFALVGDARSGVGVVRDTLNNRRDVVCHAELLSADAAARRAAHEAYFGPTPEADTSKAPPWFEEGVKSPIQYLTHDVFPRPRRGEVSVGCAVPFDDVRRLELYDVFEHLYAAGGFSLVLATRNPVAAFVSLRQAERSGTWAWDGTPPRPLRPPAVRLDADDLVAFCRAATATAGKVAAAVPDVLVVRYADLLGDYQAVMAGVFAFVELPDAPQAARPGRRRLPNRPVAERVTNWAELRAVVPPDVRGHMDADDLV